ncbi:cysteine-rich receptor-like protein kinase, partial [Trifolium medium]|nr:cysteine-rich receptor-like protein kinase [Trifolium medium]
MRRRVIGQNSLGCASECGGEESVCHLFFYCLVFSKLLWYKICHWLGGMTMLQADSVAHFAQFEGLIEGGRIFANRAVIDINMCIKVDEVLAGVYDFEADCLGKEMQEE